MPSIEAEITVLSAAEGGRSSALILSSPGAYRPHLLVEDPKQRKSIGVGGKGTEDYLGVEFRPIDQQVLPGQSARLWMDLMYHPTVNYQSLVPGATFTIREGWKVVGFGTVIQRKDAI